MAQAIQTLITFFATTLQSFITAIFGGLGDGVNTLFITTTDNTSAPSAFAYLAFMFIALSLGVGLTRWITSWIRGRLG